MLDTVIFVENMFEHREIYSARGDEHRVEKMFVMGEDYREISLVRVEVDAGIPV